MHGVSRAYFRGYTVSRNERKSTMLAVGLDPTEVEPSNRSLNGEIYNLFSFSTTETSRDAFQFLQNFAQQVLNHVTFGYYLGQNRVLLIRSVSSLVFLLQERTCSHTHIIMEASYDAVLFGNDPPLSECPEPIAIVGMGAYRPFG